MNDDFVDPWSFGHIALGYLAGKSGMRMHTFLFLSILWEWIEPSLKEIQPDSFPYPSVDTPQNKVGDVICNMIGYYAGSR